MSGYHCWTVVPTLFVRGYADRGHFPGFFVLPYYSYQSRQSHKTHHTAFGTWSGCLAPQKLPPFVSKRYLGSRWGPMRTGTEWPHGGADTDEGRETRGVGVAVVYMTGKFPPRRCFSVCAYRRQICLQRPLTTLSLPSIRWSRHDSCGPRASSTDTAGNLFIFGFRSFICVTLICDCGFPGGVELFPGRSWWMRGGGRLGCHSFDSLNSCWRWRGAGEVTLTVITCSTLSRLLFEKCC